MANNDSRRLAWFCLFVFGNLLWTTKAGEEASPDTKTHRNGPLAHLPSEPGAHLKKIGNLNDGEWLNLDQPAPDPQWGQALGRSYSPRMVYLPKQRAALLAGQGVHGGTKKGGVYEDEVFAYDINAHRWICIYPGSDVNKLDLKLDGHGFEINAQGEHVPVAILGHGYNLLTYDSSLEKVFVVPLGNTWWKKAFPRRLEWLNDSSQEWLRNPRHPWCYDLNSGKWEHRFVEGPGPDELFHGVVEYLASKKQIFFLYRGCKAWLYSPDSNQWSDPKAPLGPLKGTDWAGCFDPARERVYVGKDLEFSAYDAHENRWIRCEAPPVAIGHSSLQTLTFDTCARSVVMLVHAKGNAEGKQGIHVYDTERNVWYERLPLSDVFPKGNVNAFYDPELNVHFFHVAGDSRPNGVMLAFRWKRAAGRPGKEGYDRQP